MGRSTCLQLRDRAASEGPEREARPSGRRRGQVGASTGSIERVISHTFLIFIQSFARMPATHLKAPGAASKSNASASAVDVSQIVSGVIADVRARGDAAVRHYSEKFDSWAPVSFKLSQEQIDAAIAKVPQQTLDDIKTVQSNVRKFAQAQRESLKDFEVELSPGVHLGQVNVPINTVGA